MTSRRTIDELLRDLAAESPDLVVKACVALREIGSEALTVLSALVALLADERWATYESGFSDGGDSSTARIYVATEAALTLRKLAPHAAPDRVARALLSLQGRLERTDSVGQGDARETYLAWSARELRPFGQPLVGALRRIATSGTDDERAKARALLQTLGESASDVELPDDGGQGDV